MFQKSPWHVSVSGQKRRKSKEGKEREKFDPRASGEGVDGEDNLVQNLDGRREGRKFVV